MIKRTLYFGNPAYLSVRLAQLEIRSPEVEKDNMLSTDIKESSIKQIPIEDIGVVVLDNKQITITGYYKKGDLVIVEKRGFSRTGGYTDVIEQGDEIFAIRVDAYGNAYVEIGVVGKIYEDEQAISFENGSTFGLKFVLGEAVDTYPNIGGFLSIVESKWGFLFLVLVPCFLIFMYEIYSLIVEIKYGDED